MRPSFIRRGDIEGQDRRVVLPGGMPRPGVSSGAIHQLLVTLLIHPTVQDWMDIHMAHSLLCDLEVIDQPLSWLVPTISPLGDPFIPWLGESRGHGRCNVQAVKFYPAPGRYLSGGRRRSNGWSEGGGGRGRRRRRRLRSIRRFESLFRSQLPQHGSGLVGGYDPLVKKRHYLRSIFGYWNRRGSGR